MTKQQRDYTTEYAKKVVNGELLTSKKNVQACERHLRDLNNKANKAIKFISMLPNPKTGKKMPLASFQRFIVGSLM